MAAITDEQIKLLDEIKKDPAAFQRLKEKANWEHESLMYVLRNWGDPRTWE
jgi:hypothetical protein